jgi:KaiC/GvpD/RAD55 family RecA-like ATPase
MASDRNKNALLKKAKEHEREYKWLKAAKSYKSILRSESQTGSSAAEIWQKIGFCFNKGSRQTDNIKEFQKLKQLAAEAYKNAAKLFKEGSKNEGRIEQCTAIAEFTRSWLAPNLSKKEKSLEECCTFANMALEAFKKIGDETNYVKMCNQLLFCLFERISIAPNEKEKQSVTQEGICRGNETISVLLNMPECIENKSELLLANSLTSLHSWYAANINEREEDRKNLANKSLKFSEKAMELANEVDDPYHTAMSRWAAALSTLYFTKEIESSLEYAKEMLQQGLTLNDNYIKGIASYILTHVIDWIAAKEANPEKKREYYTKIIKYSQDAIRHLQLVSQDYHIAETYLFYTESYTHLGLEVEIELEGKRALLKKAVKIGRKGLEHAVKSSYPDAFIPTLHSLSKALQSYSNLVQGKGEQIRLLEEALGYRKEYIKIVDSAFPSYTWGVGVGKNYAGLIEAELARLEKDNDKKIALLKNAVSDMKDAISYCTKWILSRPEQFGGSTIPVVAEYENMFGGVLNELYLLIKDKKYLTQAIEVYHIASERFKGVNLPSRAAESYWKIARIQDILGENQKASKNFENAFAEYKVASRRLPHFVEFYLDHAVYMKAWSEIEAAKSAHKEKDYTVATKKYENTANLLKNTKLWSYLSSNFLAWSLMEKAEYLSRKENSAKAIESFKKANELFREAHRAIRVELSRIENTDEKDLARKLIKASRSRTKFCLGRIAVEEAKSLDRVGDHMASARKYGYAAKIFQEIAEVESGQTLRELKPLIFLCKAWQKMMTAEARASPIMYEEAATLFKQAKEYALDQQTSLLSLAHSSFCSALEAGTEFEITRDPIMISTTRKHMEAASNYYLKAGFKSASEYAKATKRLFDAYTYINNAKKETDPKKEARYYVMAEKVLKLSAEAYEKAKHPEKIKHVQHLLKNVKEEKELAESLGEVLHAPTVTSSTSSFTMLTPSEETAVGLEKFEHVEIQAKLIQPKKEIRFGEDFDLELQIVNMGKNPVLLTRVEEIFPSDFQLVAKPDYCDFIDTYLDMKGKRLEPLKTEEVKLTLKSFDIGTFQIKPRIICVDEMGNQIFRGLNPLEIVVSEIMLPNRIPLGCKELDSLLLGGIPENYSVILTSPSCDERDLLIERFLEAGVKAGQITFHITVELKGVKTLAEEFQSNFHLFICNPKSDMMIESLPNVYKLKDVTDLTDIDIALTRACRKLDASCKDPRRACIEIVSDVLLRHKAVTTRRWLTGLIPDLKSKGFITLAVMNPLMHPPDQVHAILGLFDGEINIYEIETKTGSEKFLRIKKMYNKIYVERALSLKKLK